MVCYNPYITQMAHPIFVGFRLFPWDPRARMFDLIDADENGSISKFEMFEAVKAGTTSTRLTTRLFGVGKCWKNPMVKRVEFCWISGVSNKDVDKNNQRNARKTVARNVVRNAQKLTKGWWFQIFNLIPTWGNDPIWRAYFSKGLKPPTRQILGTWIQFHLCRRKEKEEVGNFLLPHLDRLKLRAKVPAKYVEIPLKRSSAEKPLNFRCYASFMECRFLGKAGNTAMKDTSSSGWNEIGVSNVFEKEWIRDTRQFFWIRLT